MTIETERLLIASGRRLRAYGWCPECAERVELIGADDAARQADVSTRAIYRWIEEGGLHFAESVASGLLVCLPSLNASTVKRLPPPKGQQP